MVHTFDIPEEAHACQLRLRELIRGRIRHEDVPELRELAAKLYAPSAMYELINTLFNALQKSSDPENQELEGKGDDNET